MRDAAIAIGAILALASSNARADTPPTSAHVERLVGIIVAGIGAGLLFVGTTATPWEDYVSNINGGGGNFPVPPGAVACILAGGGMQLVGIPLWIAGQYRISEAHSRNSVDWGNMTMVPTPRGVGLKWSF